MCDTHADVVRSVEDGFTFEELIAWKIGNTKSWFDAQDPIYDLNDAAIVDRISQYGAYVSQDSQITLTITAPPPGETYSWFVDKKDCKNAFDIKIDWNIPIIEREKETARSGTIEVNEEVQKDEEDN